MNLLRTLISALCIVAGAALIAAWAVSSVIVTAVEDGTALRGIAEHALDSSEVRTAVAAQITDEAISALGADGLPLDEPALESTVGTALEAIASTPAFREAVLDEVDDAHEQFADELTDSLREPAPLVIEVDVSAAVNRRIDELGTMGSLVPDLALPPASFEALSADTFERTRDAYTRIEWAANWGLWTGLALLVVGVLVSQRKRWFLAKVLVLLGFICLAVGGSIALLGPETITTFVPGGPEGTLGTLWTEVLTEEAAPVVMERSLWIAGGAFVAALVVTLLGAILGGRRR